MSEKMARAYPLQWPTGWARTNENSRRTGRFTSATGSSNYGSRLREITFHAAGRRLSDELERLGGRGMVISSNLQVRGDGLPYSNQNEPKDPGAAVYFSLQNQPRVFACDTYTKVAQNLAALAAHVEAMRAMIRHGVGSTEQAFAGYAALPPPGEGQAPHQPRSRPWIEVFEPFTASILAAPAGDMRKSIIDTAYRQLAREAHPDKHGGSSDRMVELNLARDQALKEAAEEVT